MSDRDPKPKTPPKVGEGKPGGIDLKWIVAAAIALGGVIVAALGLILTFVWNPFAKPDVEVSYSDIRISWVEEQNNPIAAGSNVIHIEAEVHYENNGGKAALLNSETVRYELKDPERGSEGSKFVLESGTNNSVGADDQETHSAVFVPVDNQSSSNYHNLDVFIRSVEHARRLQLRFTSEFGNHDPIDFECNIVPSPEFSVVLEEKRSVEVHCN